MKLIVSGATGYVASEVIRQCLQRREVTSIVALARRPVSIPEGADSSKLKSIVVKDYDYSNYTEDVKKELSGADACIWTVAITPSRSKSYAFEEVRRVCQTSTLAGLKAMYEAGPSKPFRVVYMSGATGERDQTKKPMFLADYVLMRGETENQVLAFGEDHSDVEACVAKPGLITSNSIVTSALTAVAKLVYSLPSIHVKEIAAAMIDQVINGFEKETLCNADLSRIGKKALQDMSQGK